MFYVNKTWDKTCIVLTLFELCVFLSSCSEEDYLAPEWPLEPLDSLLMEKMTDADLPIVRIETVADEEPSYEIADPPKGCLGGSIRNAKKVPGRMVMYDKADIVYDSGEYVEKQSGMTMKVRGNWSARRPKKPFKIKLQRKADLLGRENRCFEDKDWLLMPFYHMNAYIGLRVNELMDLQWTPRFCYVNLVVNGEYRGLYMLMESVERNADCRLNVDRNEGYIIELDAYWWNEPNYVRASFDESLNYTFKYPDEDDLTDDKLNYVQELVSAAEKSTHDGSYQKWIDVESFARWMLAHDILGNSDGAGANMFLTKYDSSDESLLKMGCMWDFDVIMKSGGWDEIHDRYFFKGLFASENRTFVNRYVTLWQEMKGSIFDQLERDLDSYLESDLRKAVDASIIMNNDRWAVEMYGLPSSETFIEEAKAYLRQQKVWLESAIRNL